MGYHYFGLWKFHRWSSSWNCNFVVFVLKPLLLFVVLFVINQHHIWRLWVCCKSIVFFPLIFCSFLLINCSFSQPWTVVFDLFSTIKVDTTASFVLKIFVIQESLYSLLTFFEWHLLTTFWFYQNSFQRSLSSHINSTHNNYACCLEQTIEINPLPPNFWRVVRCKP